MSSMQISACHKQLNCSCRRASATCVSTPSVWKRRFFSTNPSLKFPSICPIESSSSKASVHWMSLCCPPCVASSPSSEKTGKKMTALDTHPMRHQRDFFCFWGLGASGACSLCSVIMVSVRLFRFRRQAQYKIEYFCCCLCHVPVWQYRI